MVNVRSLDVKNQWIAEEVKKNMITVMEKRELDLKRQRQGRDWVVLGIKNYSGNCHLLEVKLKRDPKLGKVVELTCSENKLYRNIIQVSPDTKFQTFKNDCCTITDNKKCNIIPVKYFEVQYWIDGIIKIICPECHRVYGEIAVRE